MAALAPAVVVAKHPQQRMVLGSVYRGLVALAPVEVAAEWSLMRPLEGSTTGLHQVEGLR